VGDEKKKRDTKSKGDVSEVTVLAVLVKLGYHVSIPYGENHRYDLVIEKDGLFRRVQVKTGRLRNGTVIFNSYSSHAHRGGKQRGYIGEAEFFGIYCSDTERVFMVPVRDVKQSAGVLRWEPARNGQSKKIRWAHPYSVSTHLPIPSLGHLAADGVT
jgi:hypothetical protein